MHIISLGLNHTSAPVQLRERFAFNDEEQVRASLARVFCGHLQTSLAELIIISTCNRTEIYASNQLAYADLERVFVRCTGGARRRTSSLFVPIPGC